jgi:hypothetical protein
LGNHTLAAAALACCQILFWKKRAEEELQRSGLSYTIVRPGGGIYQQRPYLVTAAICLVVADALDIARPLSYVLPLVLLLLLQSCCCLFDCGRCSACCSSAVLPTSPAAAAAAAILLTFLDAAILLTFIFASV